MVMAVKDLKLSGWVEEGGMGDGRQMPEPDAVSH